MKLTVLFLLCIVVLSVLVDAAIKNKARKKFLKKMNKIRSKVAKGKAPNGTSGSNLPKAKNMFQLTWSKKLEKKALKLAQICNFSSVSSTDGLAVYRQNGTLKPAAAIKSTPKGWFTTFQKYGIPSLIVNRNDSFYNRVANTSYEDSVFLLSFVQSIWAKSKTVGCGAHTCTNNTAQQSATFTYCLFKAPAQYGEVIYKKGKKLKCPKKAKPVKKTRLCKIKGKKGKKIHK